MLFAATLMPFSPGDLGKNGTEPPQPTVTLTPPKRIVHDATNGYAPRFDATLGTLLRVKVSARVSVVMDAGYSSTYTSSQTATAHWGGFLLIPLTSPPTQVNAGLSAPSAIGPYMGTTCVPFTPNTWYVSGAASDQAIITLRPGDLNYSKFIGSGNYNMGIRRSNSNSVNGTRIVTCYNNSQRSYSIKVTYVYRPN